MLAQHAHFVKRSDEPLVAAMQEGDGDAAHASVAPGDFVDGYFLIHAKDMAEAQRIAASFPHVKYGGRSEAHEFDRATDTDSP
jgi:hypothetical protein